MTTVRIHRPRPWMMVLKSILELTSGFRISGKTFDDSGHSIYWHRSQLVCSCLKQVVTKSVVGKVVVIIEGDCVVVVVRVLHKDLSGCAVVVQLFRTPEFKVRTVGKKGEFKLRLNPLV